MVSHFSGLQVFALGVHVMGIRLAIGPRTDRGLD